MRAVFTGIGWILRKLRLRLRKIHGGATGEHPSLGILRHLQVHVRGGISSCNCDDETQQTVELRGIDSNIVVSAVFVVRSDEIVGPAKIDYSGRW